MNHAIRVIQLRRRCRHSHRHIVGVVRVRYDVPIGAHGHILRLKMCESPVIVSTWRVHVVVVTPCADAAGTVASGRPTTCVVSVYVSTTIRTRLTADVEHETHCRHRRP